MTAHDEKFLEEALDSIEEGSSAPLIKDTGYYESLGMCRYTLILSKGHKTALNDIAKTYRITQGSVIEAFLDNMDAAKMEPIFRAKQTKGGGRKVGQAVTQRDLITSLKGMTAEQLAAVHAAIAATKSSST